jgi:hypothetical protein
MTGKMFFRDKKYLNYIRSLPCLVTKRNDVIAHHVRLNQSAGIGLKPSDYRAVPLDPIEHRKLHDMGERSYWLKHNIDAENEVMTQMLIYLSSRLEGADKRIGFRVLEESIWALKSRGIV